MNKTKTKVVITIVANIVLYVFLAVCIISVFFTLFSKRDSDGAAEVFGYQMRVVTSDSMGKCEHTDVSEYKIKDIPSVSFSTYGEVDKFLRKFRRGAINVYKGEII